MKSLILSTTARFLVGLLLLTSIFLLLRGHDEPGGGFIGGLAAVVGFTVYSIAEGPEALRRALRINPILLVCLGLSCAVGAGLLSIFFGKPFLTGLWWEPVILGVHLHLSSVLLFDIGVYLVVVGGIMAIVLGLEENR